MSEEQKGLSWAHTCGAFVNESMTFCPSCGKQLVLRMRDENEIKAMIDRVKKFPANPDASATKTLVINLMVSTIFVTLQWVLGTQYPSPLTALDAAAKENA